LPTTRQVCLLGSNNYENVLKCLQEAKKELSDSLSAIEFLDYGSLAFSLDYFKIDNPFRETNYKYYLLIEASGNQTEEQITEKML
jgi:hypothetical protein